MRKIFAITLMLAFIFSISAEASKVVKVKKVSGSALVINEDISTANSSSRLISIVFAPDIYDDHKSTTYAILRVWDGTTERYRIPTDHKTVITVGPYDEFSAPVFSTDIKSTIITDGKATATFSWIELE